MKRKPGVRTRRRTSTTSRQPLLQHDEVVRRAYQVALAKFGHRPMVTAVDIGLRIRRGSYTGGLAIRLHVREKIAPKHLEPRDIFPPQIEGVPIDVVEARYRRQQANDIPARRTERNPLQPGISIGHPDVTAGTLGMFVRDLRTNAICVLSAAHVIAPEDEAEPGDPTYQPGPVDGGSTNDSVASLLRADPYTDSAVAQLTGGRPFDPELFGEPGHRINTLRQPLIGEVLEKSGRSTGVTRARVDGCGQYGCGRPYGGGPLDGVGWAFRLVPIDPPSPDRPLISDDGDSGAIWYSPQDGAGVGLHSTGASPQTPMNQYGVASELVHVFQNLSIAPLA